MAGPDDMFIIPVGLDFTAANQQYESWAREKGEGVTFANPGGRGVGAEAARERVVRAQERTADTAQGVGGGVWDKQTTINAQLAVKEWAAKFAAQDKADRIQRELRESRFQDHLDSIRSNRTRAGREAPDSSGLFSGYDDSLEVDLDSERSSRRSSTLDRQRQLRRSRIPSARGASAANEWNQGGEVPFDNFDSENFGSNLDEAIGDAEGKQPNFVPAFNPQGRVSRLFSRMFGGGKRSGGMGVFYKRFLAMEALRSVGQIAQIASEEEAGLVRAEGNPVATAQFQARQEREFVTAIPFGIGQLGYAIGGGGRIDAAVARAETGERQAQAMEVQRASQLQRIALHESALTATAPRGLTRTLAAIGESEAGAIRGVTESSKKEMDAMTSLYQGYNEDIEAKRPGWFKGYVLEYNFSKEGVAENEALDEQQQNLTREQTRIRTQATQRFERQKDDVKKIHDQQRQEAISDQIVSSIGNFRTGTLGVSQTARLLRPQGTDFYDPQFAARQQKQQIDFGNEQEDYKEDQDYREYANKNKGLLGVISSGVYRFGQMGQRGLRYAQTEEQKRAVDAGTEREVGLQSIGYREDFLRSRSEINRDPRAGITASYDAERDRNRYLPPTARAAADDAATARRDAANQGQDDRMALTGGSLALSLAVSGMRAKAFGPGADAVRRGADVAEIAGSAELKAQSTLRDTGIDKDKRQSFADAERNIGVNNLEAYKANYISGFSSVAADPRNIVPGNKESSNPSEVFRSIDDGIRGLKAGIGSGDITGAKGSLGNDSVPNLLQAILNVLTNNGVHAHAQ